MSVPLSYRHPSSSSSSPPPPPHSLSPLSLSLSLSLSRNGQKGWSLSQAFQQSIRLPDALPGTNPVDAGRLDLGSDGRWREGPRGGRRADEEKAGFTGRHLVSGDSYSIKAVTREDAGRYQCQAEPWESSNSTSGKILSEPVELSVLELPPSALTLTPNSRQLFNRERFTVQCPESQTNSSGWTLKHFSSSRRDRKRDLYPDQCSPLGGAVSADNPDACAFTASSTNGGLYWCQGAEGRSNSVNITVSSGPIILKTPAFPVLEGDEVILSCQYLSSTPSKTTFFKNGAAMNTSYSFSSSNRVMKMTIENVTQADEGFYKCASQDRKMESPESWLSVIPDREDKDSTTLSERRLILIGGRWAGRSSCGNTILGKDRFECGRTRTAQCEVRHEEVQGRKLIVVDAPGWSSSLSLTEIPEGDKQRFKLNVSKCPPGPDVFLLVVPIDCAFSVEQKRTVEEHMNAAGGAGLAVHHGAVHLRGFPQEEDDRTAH
ncbi:GTPase IMAP family member 4 [Nibea albiflora]|uniref:GTPase IMAP family member 4 n=1 Tax=Nibea albiflora TaxID=240163 RepID=A0ACB7EN10_NIBAL|nr:GTPase IMAP family member 4 [Nibea albiflora]